MVLKWAIEEQNIIITPIWINLQPKQRSPAKSVDGETPLLLPSYDVIRKMICHVA